jgi:hypothetical protein
MRAHGGMAGEGDGNSPEPERVPTAFVKANKAE